jgi:hypothetical protein
MLRLRACSLMTGLVLVTISAAMAVRADQPAAAAPDETVERGEPVDPNQTGFEVPPDATPQSLLEELVPDRSDAPADWFAPLERLYHCGEPRILCPLVPPPPCHPAQPPAPYDLVGVPGSPSSGPLYEGPCNPRAGSRDHCRWPTLRRLHDSFVDRFYSPNYWPK